MTASPYPAVFTSSPAAHRWALRTIFAAEDVLTSNVLCCEDPSALTSNKIRVVLHMIITYPNFCFHLF